MTCHFGCSGKCLSCILAFVGIKLVCVCPSWWQGGVRQGDNRVTWQVPATMLGVCALQVSNILVQQNCEVAQVLDLDVVWRRLSGRMWLWTKL